MCTHFGVDWTVEKREIEEKRKDRERESDRYTKWCNGKTRDE